MIIGFLGVFLVGLFGATHISLDKDIIQDYLKESWLRVDAELMETVVGETKASESILICMKQMLLKTQKSSTKWTIYNKNY